MVVQDNILIRDFQEGNDLAFVNLYNRYKHATYVYCIKMLGDRDASKDIVQGVFLKVYERRSQLLHAESFKGWLLTIARNDCLTYLRKANRMSRLNEEVEDGIFVLPNSDVDRNEETAIVSRTIGRLPHKLKEVIILREYENLSYREIADVIGIPESTVKSRLFSARHHLYEQMKRVFTERKQQ